MWLAWSLWLISSPLLGTEPRAQGSQVPGKYSSPDIVSSLFLKLSVLKWGVAKLLKLPLNSLCSPNRPFLLPQPPNQPYRPTLPGVTGTLAFIATGSQPPDQQSSQISHLHHRPTECEDTCQITHAATMLRVHACSHA